ncbi:proteophosphoglycan ppg4 [Gigaspora margarita]|uniref:Proteophosphoglycan ppg4 n=1 Tax=Gigaspora margarita TaxID=4874 RepID=A0A8H3WXZ4_GIGMA|nr:proteophosphoglycan ppg4 [Gigaspora margarita]
MKGIKEKLLASLNGACEEELNNALSNSREICGNSKLKRFIVHKDRRLKDYSGPWTILHYLIEEELKPKGYVVENDTGHGTPLAFGLSNKENNWTIRLPSKLGVEGIVRGTILYWFHIMQSFGENLKTWNIPHSLRYQIVLGFKFVGCCCTEKDAFEMASHYKAFINSLPLDSNQKLLFIKDLENNWMCDEWRIQFIGAGCLPIGSNI